MARFWSVISALNQSSARENLEANRPMPYSQWPQWVQAVVVIPHVLLAMAATLLWWPKTKRNFRRFTIVALYLLVFFVVMHYVFKA